VSSSSRRDPAAAGPPTGAVEPGRFHRLGIAIRQGQDDPAAWFERVLGARVEPTRPEPGDVHLTTKARVGATDLAVFAAPPSDGVAGSEGVIGRFVDRYGSGLHSLAWHVDDLWVAENVLRRRGIAVTGTNVEARHFFMHPRDTFGILVEWTDHSPTGPPVPDSTVPRVAYVTAAVTDLFGAVRFFEEVCGGQAVERYGVGPRDVEDTVDLQIGDIVLRLVCPRSSGSRFAAFLDGGGRGLHSFALAVDDPAFPVERGLRVAERTDAGAWTDPATTLGLRMEWVCD
jgi:catechol 2,3-dioxygenase-like lactoylglutathione lyase family enzyme